MISIGMPIIAIPNANTISQACANNWSNATNAICQGFSTSLIVSADKDLDSPTNGTS